jgi:carboxypeptidase C (cathepsin A)
LRDCPLYITGESFAGHYVPAFARTIISNATFLAETNVKLKGIAIGDGWTDPINQINFYDSMLYSAGIVSNKYRDAATWFQTQGILNIYKKDYVTVLIFL